jgi:sigma-B regulation protein RsbU (phosphoserine phosphatase)
MNDDREASKNRDAVKLERLELALRASNEGIWDWITDRKEIYYSRRILEFLECGRDRAPNLFLAPFDSVHLEDRASFQRAVDQALDNSGPETLAVDARILTGSGDWRWLRIRANVERTRSGETFRIAGSMIDISRRKAAEAQVEDERYLLRHLIDHIPVQVYFKDLESCFVMANKGMAEWIGLTEGTDLSGKHDRDFFDENHWKPAEKDEHEIIRTGKPILEQIEHEVWHQGDETWVKTSKFPWHDRHGNIKGTFGVSSDVTDLVTARRKATQLAGQLQVKNEAYEEEVSLAREIQQALTGRGFPGVSNEQKQIRFGSRYIPISGLAGDFFEVIQVSDDCVGVLICDVMGHGVRSALIVAMLRGLLEKQRSQASEPGGFLHGLNDGLAAILERAGTTMFATAFYGFIDLASNTFSYACAGHPGPIVETMEGVQQLATERSQKGPGLGLIRGSAYPTISLPLDSLKRMILFTDGVIEAENQQGEPFFENRLMEIIARNSGEPLGDMLDGILKSVLDFSKTLHFDDDVCLLGVDISPA